MAARLTKSAKFEMESNARLKEADSRFVKRRPAPMVLRCGALLIDYVLIAAVLVLSTIFARIFGGGARTAGMTVESIGYLLTVVAIVINFGLLPVWHGQTVGKWATGLRLEQRKDGRKIGLGRAFLRHFIGYPLSLLTVGIGYLIAIFNAQGLTLHDLIAQTIVVRDIQPPRRGGRPF